MANVSQFPPRSTKSPRTAREILGMAPLEKGEGRATSADAIPADTNAEMKGGTWVNRESGRPVGARYR